MLTAKEVRAFKDWPAAMSYKEACIQFSSDLLAMAHNIGIRETPRNLPALTPSYATWYSNHDGFWNDDDKPHVRMI